MPLGGAAAAKAGARVAESKSKKKRMGKGSLLSSLKIASLSKDYDVQRKTLKDKISKPSPKKRRGKGSIASTSPVSKKRPESKPRPTKKRMGKGMALTRKRSR